MTQRRVLIVSYYFPPYPEIASVRIGGLVKHIREFGWDPVVLTAVYPGRSNEYCTVIETPYPGDVTARWKAKLGLKADEGLQEQLNVPRAVRESKKATLFSKLVGLAYTILVYPDNQKDWLLPAVNMGLELLKGGQFDAIISSSGPVTCHLIASKIKARYKLPWVADFRDLWTQNHYYPYGVLRRKIERQLELKIINTANALVTVSEPLAEQLRELHLNKRVIAIPNGFDPDEVEAAPLTQEFSITYTGQLYKGRRDPEPLLRAIYELIRDGVLDPQYVRIRFYGTTEYWLEQLVKRYQLTEVVNLHSKVPRDIALSKQSESHVLLLLNWDDPNEKGIYTGKVFEYLAARRPILCVGGPPDSVVSQLLLETGSGIHCRNIRSLKTVIKSWYDEYKLYGTPIYKGDWAVIERYSHREMARKFSSLLAEVIDV